jgi:hypothetical protein
MNRLKTRWTAWPAALLLVLSLSGAAGASALISFKQPATHVVQTSDQDEDGDQGEATDDQDADADEDADEAPDTDVEDQDTEDAQLPTAEQLAECGVEPQAEDQSHGEYVSGVAKSDAEGGDVDGDNDNHGFCVSAAARGLFNEETETEDTTQQTECSATEDTTDVEDQDVETASNHGASVSEVAKDPSQVDLTPGGQCNHGGAVSKAAHDKGDEARANKAKNGLEHGKRHGRGHRPS